MALVEDGALLGSRQLDMGNPGLDQEFADPLRPILIFLGSERFTLRQDSASIVPKGVYMLTYQLFRFCQKLGNHNLPPSIRSLCLFFDTVIMRHDWGITIAHKSDLTGDERASSHTAGRS